MLHITQNETTRTFKLEQKIRLSIFGTKVAQKLPQLSLVTQPSLTVHVLLQETASFRAAGQKSTTSRTWLRRRISTS